MSRRKLNLLCLVGCVLFTAHPPLRAQLAVGGALPDLSMSALDGQLPATAGQVLLVDFWASWCAPCKASFPTLTRLQSAYGRRRVLVQGVRVDQSAHSYAMFHRKNTPLFATVRDGEQRLVSTVKVPAMPTSYLIGRDGLIRAIFAGYHGPDTDKAIRDALDATLAENSLP